jgi:hypothetical protein
MQKTTLELMLEARDKYTNPKEIIGTALYRIEKVHNIPLAEMNNELYLQRLYNANKKDIDATVKSLLKVANPESSRANSKGIASVFVEAFQGAFNQIYGEWRQSLSQPIKIAKPAQKISYKPGKKKFR